MPNEEANALTDALIGGRVVVEDLPVFSNREDGVFLTTFNKNSVSILIMDNDDGMEANIGRIHRKPTFSGSAFFRDKARHQKGIH